MSALTVSSQRSVWPSWDRSEMTTTIDRAADYIIARLAEAGGGLTVLKLQKLLYYAQAWHLAFRNAPLFRGGFQAWIHGPVNRDIYDRFKGSKMLYSGISERDVTPSFTADSVPFEDRAHIDSVLEVYAAFSGTELEVMTHQEEPWMTARGGLRDTERCEALIDESLMQRYYSARIAPSATQ